MNSQQVSIIVLFLTIIVIITYFYTHGLSFPMGNSNSNIENYQNEEEQQPAFMKQYSTVVKDFQKVLDKYKSLDIPITITNNGVLCQDWGTYADGKYSRDGNKCLVMPNKTLRQCMVYDNLSSCSSYYKDGTIDELNKIPTDEIFSAFVARMQTSTDTIDKTISSRLEKINPVLDNLINQKNIENQQQYFINYNDGNVNDKKTMLDKTTQEFDKEDNEIRINQVNFSNLLQKNKKDEADNEFYYKILKYIFYAIIITAIANLLFSDIL
jgi:hypothetical protein